MPDSTVPEPVPANSSRQKSEGNRVGASKGRQAIERWFSQQGWECFTFQLQTWQAWQNGDSGLIHSPTGSGKSLAAWLGPVQHAIDYPVDHAGVKVLWITPLRALATDTCMHLQEAVDALGCDWRVETRTGDTSSSKRSKQRSHPPDALVTTPESLSVLLSYANSEQYFRRLTTVIVDEWHELLGSKRGVQLELCLARLDTSRVKSGHPLRVWGLSATLANLDTAIQTLLGTTRKGLVVSGKQARDITIRSALPGSIASFPWSGHLGLAQLDSVLTVIDNANSTLLFTNTRSQAELWFEAIIKRRGDLIGSVALHHGSIDRKLRTRIEGLLREGKIKCVVCTSSLDLGVDFSPVDQVIQVGSPKGVARLRQRAGRSGHHPDGHSDVFCVAAHAFELVEFTAVRQALMDNAIEAREPLRLSLDVLAQHLVTVALGGGFIANELLQEVRTTHAFAELDDRQWQWALDFVTRGGQALQGYEQYNRVVERDGVYRVINARIAGMHRMSIGTIGGDTTMHIKWLSGGRLGMIEESFVSRLAKGDSFLFSGRLVELVMVREMTAYVRKTSKRRRWVPRWQGGRFSLSSQLANQVVTVFEQWQQGHLQSPELAAIEQLLRLQTLWSRLPVADELLVEQVKQREGYSVFIFPFAGRLAHEGLATLAAWRLSRKQALTLTLSVNDYGFELLSKDPLLFDEALVRELLCVDNLLEDLLASLNTSELAKRQFRDISRIAGLVFQGYPGRGKSSRQVQASSSLIYDVLRQYDAGNLLLEQAQREVLESQLEFVRIQDALHQLVDKRVVMQEPGRLTPLSFPLWAERLQSQVISSENWRTRVEKMRERLESKAETTLQKQQHALEKQNKDTEVPGL